MSRHWHLYCKTCDSRHDFDNMNHQERVMFALIEHRHTLGSLLGAVQADDLGLELTCSWSSEPIHIDWFARHHNHELYAQDEYGVIARDVCTRCAKEGPTRALRIVGHPATGHYCDACVEWAQALLKGAL